jgi:hypothetical protein
LLLTSLGLAHPLADQAKAIEEQALVLRQRMGPDNPNLTWGQNMALEDMTRLASAASAARQALEPDEVDWDSTRSTLMEMQVAGNRVRMSLPVSILDSEGQSLGQQMIVQVQEIDREARAQRDQTFERRVGSSRPNVSFGIGFGNYWGTPWPYGYGFRGGFFPGYFGGYRGFGRRCR